MRKDGEKTSSNASYICPQCDTDGKSATGHRWDRFISCHLLERAKKHEPWRKLAFSVYPDKARAALAPSTASAETGDNKRAKVDVDPTQKLLTTMFNSTTTVQSRFRLAVAQMCIELKLPNTLIEEPAFVDLIEKVVEIARTSKQNVDTLLYLDEKGHG